MRRPPRSIRPDSVPARESPLPPDPERERDANRILRKAHRAEKARRPDPDRPGHWIGGTRKRPRF